MEEVIRNENGNEPQLLTIGNAANHLKVSIPRLRRLLARPEYAPLLQSFTHRTPTGDRQAQGVDVSDLETLRSGLDGNGIEPERKQERERIKSEREQEQIRHVGDDAASQPDVSALESRLTDLVATVEHERAERERERLQREREREQERIEREREREDRAGEVGRLNAALERESAALHEAQSLHLGTMAELQRWRRQAEELEAANARLIAATVHPVEPSTRPAETANDASGGDFTASGDAGRKSTQAAGQSVLQEAPKVQEAAPEQPRRGFWARLMGR